MYLIRHLFACGTHPWPGDLGRRIGGTHMLWMVVGMPRMSHEDGKHGVILLVELNNQFFFLVFWPNPTRGKDKR